MKIALWWHLQGGGAKRLLRDHVRLLVERGHEVHAWCPSLSDREYLPLEGLAGERILPLEALPPGRRFGPMERHARKVAEEIDAGGFDVLYAHSCRWFSPPHVARYCRTPSVVFVHEPLRHLHESLPYPVWSEPSSRPFLDRLGNLLVLPRRRRLLSAEWTNAQSPRTLIVNSLFTREAVRRAYARDSQVCPTGVDVEYWMPSDASRENLVAGLGTILPHKGLDVAIRALAKLPGPKPKLEWIGNFTGGNYKDEMEDMARRAGVPLTIRMGVPQDQVRNLLQRASVFFFPARLEPLGYAPLEASACGCPVVGFKEGGVRETVLDGQTGWLAQHEGEFPWHIHSLLSLPDEVRRMGDAGRAWVRKEWALGNAAQFLEDVLREAALGKESSASISF